MTTTVFVYIMLFTLLLAAAASAVEWGTQGRIAARHIWSVAIALAVLAPPTVLVLHTLSQRATISAPQASAGSGELTTIAVSSARAGGRITSALVSRDAPIRSLVPNRQVAIAILSRWNLRLANIGLAVWALLSLSVVAWLAASVFHWHRAQLVWQTTTLDGVSIHVSPFTGPAVLGFLSQRIVIPTWTMRMKPEHRRLVLAHECEHVNACDPQRLAFGIAALILMPWNIGLWWCVARLRRAIELDCDARVLRRFPDAREYGYVLLEVAARGRNTGPLAVAMVGLLSLPPDLELRLRAMTRPRSASARTIAIGSVVAIVAISAAFSAPVPALRSAILTRAARSADRDFSSPPRVPVSRRQLLFGAETRSDTLRKRHADSVTSLRRQLDSVKVLLRELQDKAAAASPDARQLFETLSQTSVWSDSAVPRYYPNIVTHPDERAVLWFVSDNTGHVLRTKRDDSFGHHVLTIDSTHARFPDLNPSSIERISLMGKRFGTTNITVAWAMLKNNSAR